MIATALAAFALVDACGALAQSPAPTPAPAAVKITLDDAIRLALEHNHNLAAQRSTIQQNQAEEVTANLRPNPVFSADTNYLPIFQPSEFNSTYLDNSAEFDLDVSYLIERGQKRQRRLQAARDQTAISVSQVNDNERSLTFQVASGFIGVQLAESTLELAQQDLKDFQNTVNINQERYMAGDISQSDYLKIKLQLLQFQTDVAQAQMNRTQALSDLRHQLGFESVPANYDVVGDLQYTPAQVSLDDLEMKALATRPDLLAAKQSVTGANSQLALQHAIGKQDLTVEGGYTHTNATNSALILGSINIPIFNRNQGEIAKAQYAVGQAQEAETYTNEQVLTDVRDAYSNLQENDQVVRLYRSGYLDTALQSRDISEYAFQRGASSLLDFLDAERSYRDTELGYRQALASAEMAVEQLREAVGTRNLP